MSKQDPFPRAMFGGEDGGLLRNRRESRVDIDDP